LERKFREQDAWYFHHRCVSLFLVPHLFCLAARRCEWSYTSSSRNHSLCFPGVAMLPASRSIWEIFAASAKRVRNSMRVRFTNQIWILYFTDYFCFVLISYGTGPVFIQCPYVCHWAFSSVRLSTKKYGGSYRMDLDLWSTAYPAAPILYVQTPLNLCAPLRVRFTLVATVRNAWISAKNVKPERK
jgi:hypothetical protein